jgi:hypothetical protein
MNSPVLHEKVTADGARADVLARSDKSPRDIIEELYLLAYCRFPADDEVAICLKDFQAPSELAQATARKGPVPEPVEGQQEPPLQPVPVQEGPAPGGEGRVVPAAIAGSLADRRRAVEDLLWALLNTPEFLFKD